MKWIKDSLYGDTEIPSLVEKLIDTHEMQRLRRLQQIPFGNLVYPGANHTRFEHSIGVYELTRRFCNYLGLDRDDSLKLEVYGLLHDVGHTAFPHALEWVLEQKTGLDHERAGLVIIRKSEISEILGDNGLDPKEISKILDSDIGKVIHGDLGTDRVDYLMRDSKYTGVAYGAIDADRIMRKQTVMNGKLVLDISGLSVAESLLMARFMMFASVYNHKTRISASRMLEKAVVRAIDNGILDVRELIKLDDWSLISRLMSSGDEEIERLVKSILDRKLYKRAIESRLKDVKNWESLEEIKRGDVEKLERELAEDLGLSDLDIIFYIPRPWFKNLSIPVIHRGRVQDISEISLISRILGEAQWDYMSIYVLTKRELVDKVKPKAESMISSLTGS